MKQLQLPKRFQVALWIIRRAVFCLRIFGLAPFSVGTVTPSIFLRRTRIRTFRFSRIGLVYNFLLSIVLTTFMTALVYQDLRNHSFQNEDIVMQFIYVIQVIARAMSTGIVLISWTLRQRSAICIMNNLFEVEVQISGLRKQLSNKRTLIFSIFQLMINVVIWMTFWITEIILNPYAGNFKVSLWTITTSHITYWFIMEYVVAVSLIARSLETINENLLNLEEAHYTVSCPLSVSDFLQDSGSKPLNSQLATLRSLIRIREKISDVCQDVGAFFAFSILNCIVYVFVAVVYINYKFIVNPSVSPLPFSGFIMWVAIHLYPVILLSSVVTETSTQGKRTAFIVRKILNSPMNREIEAELEKFSLHLLHDDFTFTCYGLFALDFTLLNSLTGATMTYLVILLQSQAPIVTKQ